MLLLDDSSVLIHCTIISFTGISSCSKILPSCLLIHTFSSNSHSQIINPSIISIIISVDDSLIISSKIMTYSHLYFCLAFPMMSIDYDVSSSIRELSLSLLPIVLSLTYPYHQPPMLSFSSS